MDPNYLCLGLKPQASPDESCFGLWYRVQLGSTVLWELSRDSPHSSCYFQDTTSTPSKKEILVLWWSLVIFKFGRPKVPLSCDSKVKIDLCEWGYQMPCTKISGLWEWCEQEMLGRESLWFSTVFKCIWHQRIYHELPYNLASLKLGE